MLLRKGFKKLEATFHRAQRTQIQSDTLVFLIFLIQTWEFLAITLNSTDSYFLPLPDSEAVQKFFSIPLVLDLQPDTTFIFVFYCLMFVALASITLFDAFEVQSRVSSMLNEVFGFCIAIHNSIIIIPTVYRSVLVFLSYTPQEFMQKQYTISGPQTVFFAAFCILGCLFFGKHFLLLLLLTSPFNTGTMDQLAKRRPSYLPKDKLAQSIPDRDPLEFIISVIASGLASFCTNNFDYGYITSIIVSLYVLLEMFFAIWKLKGYIHKDVTLLRGLFHALIFGACLVRMFEEAYGKSHENYYALLVYYVVGCGFFMTLFYNLFQLGIWRAISRNYFDRGASSAALVDKAMKYFYETYEDSRWNLKNRVIVGGMIERHIKNCPNESCISRKFDLTSEFTQDDEYYSKNYILEVIACTYNFNLVQANRIVYLELALSYVNFICEKQKKPLKGYSFLTQYIHRFQKQLSNRQLQTVKKALSTLRIRYNSHLEASELRINDVADFEQLVDTAKEEVRTLLQEYIGYYEELLESKIELEALATKGTKLNRRRAEIDIIMEQILKFNSKSSEVIEMVQLYLEAVSTSSKRSLFELCKAFLRHYDRHQDSANSQTNIFGKNTVAIFLSIELHSLGVVKKCSENIRQILGYKANDVVGNDVAFLMPAQIARAHSSYLLDFLREEKHSLNTDLKTVDSYAVNKNKRLIPVTLKIRIETSHHSVFFSGLLMKREINEFQIILDKVGNIQYISENMEAIIDPKLPRFSHLEGTHIMKLIPQLYPFFNFEDGKVCGYSQQSIEDKQALLFVSKDAEEKSAKEFLFNSTSKINHLDYSVKSLLEMVETIQDNVEKEFYSIYRMVFQLEIRKLKGGTELNILHVRNCFPATGPKWQNAILSKLNIFANMIKENAAMKSYSMKLKHTSAVSGDSYVFNNGEEYSDQNDSKAQINLKNSIKKKETIKYKLAEKQNSLALSRQEKGGVNIEYKDEVSLYIPGKKGAGDMGSEHIRFPGIKIEEDFGENDVPSSNSSDRVEERIKTMEMSLKHLQPSENSYGLHFSIGNRPKMTSEKFHSHAENAGNIDTYSQSSNSEDQFDYDRELTKLKKNADKKRLKEEDYEPADLDDSMIERSLQKNSYMKKSTIPLDSKRQPIPEQQSNVSGRYISTNRSQIADNTPKVLFQTDQNSQLLGVRRNDTVNRTDTPELGSQTQEQALPPSTELADQMIDPDEFEMDQQQEAKDSKAKDSKDDTLKQNRIPLNKVLFKAMEKLDQQVEPEARNSVSSKTSGRSATQRFIESLIQMKTVPLALKVANAMGFLGIAIIAMILIITYSITIQQLENYNYVVLLLSFPNTMMNAIAGYIASNYKLELWNYGFMQQKLNKSEFYDLETSRHLTAYQEYKLEYEEHFLNYDLRGFLPEFFAKYAIVDLVITNPDETTETIQAPFRADLLSLMEELQNNANLTFKEINGLDFDLHAIENNFHTVFTLLWEMSQNIAQKGTQATATLSQSLTSTLIANVLVALFVIAITLPLYRTIYTRRKNILVLQTTFDSDDIEKRRDECVGLLVNGPFSSTRTFHQAAKKGKMTKAKNDHRLRTIKRFKDPKNHIVSLLIATSIIFGIFCTYFVVRFAFEKIFVSEVEIDVQDFSTITLGYSSFPAYYGLRLKLIHDVFIHGDTLNKTLTEYGEIIDQAEDYVDQFIDFFQYVDSHFSEMRYLDREYVDYVIGIRDNDLCTFIVKEEIAFLYPEEWCPALLTSNTQLGLPGFLTSLKQEMDIVHDAILRDSTNETLVKSYTLTDIFYETSPSFDLIHDVIVHLQTTSSDSVTNTINSQKQSEIIILAAGLVMCLLLLLLAWIPFINRMKKDLHQVKELLLVIPIIYVSKNTLVKTFLKKNQKI